MPTVGSKKHKLISYLLLLIFGCTSVLPPGGIRIASATDVTPGGESDEPDGECSLRCCDSGTFPGMRLGPGVSPGGFSLPRLTSHPIHLRRGAVLESTTDLSLPGGGLSWSHRRSYDSGTTESTSGRNLTWVADRPRLISLTGDEVLVSQSSTNARKFTGSAPTLTSPKDYDSTMTKASVTDTDDLDNDGNTGESLDVYTLTENSTGKIFIFLGFDSDVETEYRGRRVEETNRSYQANGLSGATYAYNSDGNVSVVTTAEPQSWRIDYTYTTAGGTKQVDKIEVRNGPLTSDTVIKKAEYTYYDELYPANTALGSDGDLVQAKISSLASDSTNWISRTTQYRYYRSGQTDGEAHQLKMAFEADAVQRAIDNESAITSADDMLAEADTLVDDYSSRAFTYYTEDLSTDNSGYYSDYCVTPWSTSSGEDLNTKYGGSEFDEYNDTEMFGAVKTESIGGCSSCGSGATGIKRSYFYMDLNGGTSTDPTEVVRIVVEDTEDGASPRVARYRRIWGLNFRSVALREVFIEDPSSLTRVWGTSKILDSDMRLVERRLPSAHVSQLGSNTNLKKFFNPTISGYDSDTVSSSTGVVYYYEYDTAHGDGNHVTGTLVRKGAGSGSRYYVDATDWGKGATGQPTFLPIARYSYAKQVASRSDSSRAATNYTYTFWDGGETAIKTAAVQLPVVPTSQNGSGTYSPSSTTYFDEEGRVRWQKDGEGYVNYYSYHPTFGGVALAVRDVNTSSLPSDITGNGGGKWTAWSGSAGIGRGFGLPTALEVTSKAEFDVAGRQVKVTTPSGKLHYTRYDTDKVTQFPYWNGGTSGSSTLPARIVKTNAAGVVLERYSVRPAKTQWDSGAGLPKLSTHTAADYVARVRNQYDPSSGQLESVDRFYDASSSSGYYRTTLLYDDMGRRAASAQFVETGKYQVNAQLIDVLGRVVETRKGVSSSVPAYGSLDNSSPGTPSGFSGYATTGTVLYDLGGVGDSHVTRVRTFYGTGSSDYLEWNLTRTFRGQLRGIGKKNGGTTVNPYILRDIDWEGRTTATASYATAPLYWDAEYGDVVAYSSGGSAYRPKTAGHYNTQVYRYDDRGRVFREYTYPGSESTKHTLKNNYYDGRGALVASSVENGLARELAYDGLGRNYEIRTVTSLEPTKYSSGAFNYRSPKPSTRYGTGNETALTGGDDAVVTLRHVLLSDESLPEESHFLEARHTDTNGIDLSADDDYIRSSTYSWYDDANRLDTIANHGSGNGAGSGLGLWQYTALPSSVSKPSSSTDASLVTKIGYNSDSGRQEMVTSPSGAKSKIFYDDLGRESYGASNWVNFTPSNVAGTIGGGTNHEQDVVVGMQYNGLDIGHTLTAYNASSSTANQVTRYEFEDDYNASLVTKQIYPDGNTSTDNVRVTYDLDGAVKTSTDQRGVVLTNTYDTARRLSLQAASSLPSSVDNYIQSIGRGYDSLGRLETITSYAGTNTSSSVRNQIKYTFNSTGLVSKSTQDHSGPVGGSEPSVQYAYDLSASSNVYNDGPRLETITYPDGRVVHYGYDNAAQGTFRDRSSLVAEMRDTNSSGQQLATYQYMGTGRVARTDYPQPSIYQTADYSSDGIYENWDRFGRVIDVGWLATGSPAFNYKDRVKYGYDRDSNRTYRDIQHHNLSGVSTDHRDQKYTHDGLNRLTDIEEGTYSSGSITGKKFEQSWKLDQLGNWEELDQDDTGNGTWDLEQSRNHNSFNEITSIGIQSGGAGTAWAPPAHDAAGNMTTIPKPTAPNSSFSAKYDAWNRLASLDNGSTASFQYDGLSRRTKRSGGSTRHFYYNSGWQVVSERASESGSPDKHFVWGSQYVDELVLRDHDADANSGNGLESRHYATHDALFSTTSIVDSSGTVDERYAYTPYGESSVLDAVMSTKSGTSHDWEHRFTGRRLDPQSGLQLNRHRYLNPTVGSWINRDPIGFEGSEWSLYEYVDSAPTVGMDPAGQANLWNPFTWGLDHHGQSWGQFANPLAPSAGFVETGVAFGGGVLQGGANIGVAVGNMGQEFGSSGVDLLGSGAELATFGYYHHEDWSNTAQGLSNGSFGYGEYYWNFGANTVTAGTYSQVVATYQYYHGQIDANTYSGQMGATGLMQLGSAGAVHLWGKSGGGQFAIGIGPAPKPYPFHTSFGFGRFGKYQWAEGLGPGQHVTTAFAGPGKWGNLTGIPIRNPEAIGTWVQGLPGPGNCWGACCRAFGVGMTGR